MALLNYTQQSFFKDIFDPIKDFGWNYPYEMPEEIQQLYDPVGFWYFHKDNVRPIVRTLRRINDRVELRDVLRDMDRIWRYNNKQHTVLNEPDWVSANDVAKRVKELTKLTIRRLSLQNRADNQVSSDVVRTWEYSEPMSFPVTTKGTLSGQVALVHPAIMAFENRPLFANVSQFDKRVFIAS